MHVHSLGIHPPVDGHLRCLQFGAVMNEAAMNICYTCVFMGICFYLFRLGKYLGVELLIMEQMNVLL